jgi:hypothetical protein
MKAEPRHSPRHGDPEGSLGESASIPEAAAYHDRLA